jgi:hypothetical protein
MHPNKTSIWVLITKTLCMKIPMIASTLIICLFYGSVAAQKVGVNKSNPIATLDVAGSINTDSILTVKGQVGQEGQVLMAMADNQMAWQTPNFPGADQFKYWRYYLSNGTFTIPEGVSRIFVEAWGGGGGGILNMGGGSGGYAAGYFNVNAGQEINIVIGAGGAGAENLSSQSADGGNTIVTMLSNSITAQGGKGAIYALTEELVNTISGGLGGGYSFQGPATRMQYGANGLPGISSSKKIFKSGAIGDYVDYTYGAGGNTPMWPAPTGGRSAQRDAHETTTIVLGSEGFRPGGGGGSRWISGVGLNFGGYNGGPGLVRIGY